MPTSAATHPPQTTGALEQLVERLFAATSAEALAVACQAFADANAPGVRVSWRHDASASASEGAASIILARDSRATRVLEARCPHASSQDNAPWPWIARMVRQRLDQLTDLDSLYGTVARLAQAERLQRALYTIADLVVAARDTTSMMQALHHTISTLTYAENFYVVLYDHVDQTIRFPYYVDSTDTTPPDPDATRSLDAIAHEITWHMIRENRSFMGNPETLARQASGALVTPGVPCADWLGVPMHHGDTVTGGLVVQAYDQRACYTEQDRELLMYVAQHLQTALDRREATAKLEDRVTQRTRALRETNRMLQHQVLERQRGERLQAALFRIAELASGADSLDAFYAAVHQVIGTLIYARNFYIALLEDHGDESVLVFPYTVDQIDAAPQPRTHGHGMTEYVLRHGKPLLVDDVDTERLLQSGEVSALGSRSTFWLGVPLIWNNKVMGALVVQSYSEEHTYGPRDQELLTFVSYHIANALQRRQANDELKQAYVEMERRVVERTRALALANRDLRKQVSERERVERRLKYETLHDPLTGLPNRALLLQRLEVAMKHYRADPTRLFAVLFIDLDRFKVINDSVGHLVGDDLLFQVGGRIRGCLKSRDTVARLGGDEFAVLLESMRVTDAAQSVADRIIEALHKPFRVGVKELFTSASVGISFATPAYRHADDLLRDADSAMYSAKAGGRHRSATFDDRLRHQALEVLEIENDLRRSLDQHAFVPYYQPVVNMDNGRTVGYEALLRWHHPERGVLLPGDFLRVAEDSGCIEDIDWQIFEQVCRDADALTGDAGCVSINLSARHFRAPGLEERLLQLLATHHVSPQKLRLEVTEGTLLESPIRIKRALETFRSHGMHIALDDFGTGYSSLSYMHQYPIEVIKIDQSFVANLEESDQNQSNVVVRAILALASSLDIQVIAEGIETPLQEHVLKRMGCRVGQGFLYARAQPIEVLTQAAVGNFAAHDTSRPAADA
ncbi:MAG TPA: EAL domain-containing protein [Oleiagrimonas sp.]|nr:EAL domain-containing protein [Oleiagrimonas sp.]